MSDDSMSDDPMSDDSMSDDPMSDDLMSDETFEFIVQKLPEGGYIAQSVGACIVTEADDLESLKREICDAVCCHFDDNCKPRRVKLRFVEVVREEFLEP